MTRRLVSRFRTLGVTVLAGMCGARGRDPVASLAEFPVKFVVSNNLLAPVTIAFDETRI